VDETDSCCKTQAECYEHVQAKNSSCIKNGKYHAVYYDDQVQCVDNDGTSNYDLCKCDKQAAECFKRSLPTFDSNNSNISLSAVCQPESEYTLELIFPTFQRDTLPNYIDRGG
jgi:hypothetical protein